MRAASSLAGLAMCSALLLTGCTFSSTTLPSTSSGAPLRGSVHGGQARIIGSKIYLLEASNTGYGNASKSLLTSAAGNGPDSIGYYVTSDSTGSFLITGDYTCDAGAQVYLYVNGGNSGGSGSNSGIGLMTALGQCPADGTFNNPSDPIYYPFIVVNEVTTIAAAYALAGFATDATHVGSSSTTLGKQGIANAFANAANLANIGGVALVATPTNRGNPPQSEINTLANILGACVNTNGPTSANCTTLFSNAQLNGPSGGQPTDTAAAAINIAHNPGTVNISNLFGLQAGVAAPFTPNLSSAPNDFTVAISIRGGYNYGIAIDASGNVWLAGWDFHSIFVLSNSLGSSQSYDYTNNCCKEPPYYIAIDPFGNAWVLNHKVDSLGSASVVKFTSSLAVVPGFPVSMANYPNDIAIDATGNAWITASTDGNGGGSYLTELVWGGGNANGSPFTPSGLSNPYEIAFDASSDLWITNTTGISVLTSNGANVSGSPFAPSGSGLSSGGTSIAIGASGNAWIVSANGNSVAELSSTGSLVSGSPFTGGGLAGGPIAIDGAGNAWVGNSGLADYQCISCLPSCPTCSVTELSTSGTPLSPSTGFQAGTQQNTVNGLVFPAGIAIDGSGNVWVSTLLGSGLMEFVGAATPVVTPIVANLLPPYSHPASKP